MKKRKVNKYLKRMRKVRSASVEHGFASLKKNTYYGMPKDADEEFHKRKILDKVLEFVHYV